MSDRFVSCVLNPHWCLAALPECAGLSVLLLNWQEHAKMIDGEPYEPDEGSMLNTSALDDVSMVRLMMMHNSCSLSSLTCVPSSSQSVTLLRTDLNQNYYVWIRNDASYNVTFDYEITYQIAGCLGFGLGLLISAPGLFCCLGMVLFHRQKAKNKGEAEAAASAGDGSAGDDMEAPLLQDADMMPGKEQGAVPTDGPRDSRLNSSAFYAPVWKV